MAWAGTHHGTAMGRCAVAWRLGAAGRHVGRAGTVHRRLAWCWPAEDFQRFAGRCPTVRWAIHRTAVSQVPILGSEKANILLTGY
ncbi:hypothetical protein Taro_008875 [Colocasia esculenta]|uniref:Uncharacterized protein n=1 Tax=Colocasia esculenta TaxID=4460 RepID=A0A843U8C3_COLES|nr:hypothetical protein [Colocasia esculenta]